MNDLNLNNCGCCEGLDVATPAVISNPPGLSAIAYRVGTYLSFKQSMLARLSAADLPALSGPTGLGSRSNEDFSIALFDAWAITADVLTFYQERLANESYVRTASERASLIQIAGLVSYSLQPGVAANTYLAFTLEDSPGAPGQATIALRTKAQSLPNPGEQPQTFETVEQIEARAAWNTLQPRLTQTLPLSLDLNPVLLQGTSTNLRPGDILLFVVPKDQNAGFSTAFRRVSRVVANPAAQQTQVYLEGVPLSSSTATTPKADSNPPPLPLDKPLPLDNKTIEDYLLNRIISQSDLEALARVQGWSISDLFANLAAQSSITKPPPAETGIFALRQRASLFGHNAPDWKAMPDTVRQTYFKAYQSAVPGDKRGIDQFTDWPFIPLSQNVLDLDRSYPTILNKSWVVLTWADGTTVIAQVSSITETGDVNYTLAAKIPRLTLQTKEKSAPTSIDDIRRTSVYGQSEQLILARLPIVEPVDGNTLELNGLYEGLSAGRTLIVAGELADADGVQASEVVVIASIQVDTSYPGCLTQLVLEGNLANSYKRNTVLIYGNVARATSGETVQNEVIGSGDASQPYQRFQLHQGPLTYITAPTPSGVASTLSVYINDVQWQEVPTLQGKGPRDRVFVTTIQDDGTTIVQFGNGITGARLPTGTENVKATYRKGIGVSGLVKAGQISLLKVRPLGVKGVTNPEAPTDAEDPETLEDARGNAAVIPLTMERLVSVTDYEAFALSFVGIKKALATWISNSQVRGVFVTVAGPDGQPIDESASLYKKLFQAMRSMSDPTISLHVQSFRKVLFRIAARVKIAPEYPPDQVLSAVEQALRAHFSFDARSFGQSVTLKEVISVIQSVPGVVTLVVDKLHRIGDPLDLNEVLEAAVPQATAGADTDVTVATLLMLDPGPIESLEVMI